MMAAMCKLSCRICDSSVEEPRRDKSNRKDKFKNIEQLKGHLYGQHRMLMCTLCLEGRKVFIAEQKLYTSSQLRQHISTGDSEVDGKQSERCGFSGHPMCEFCRNPFYGDTELYMHMSTEHYICHICQRQHPGQYDYYRNYDDLEKHFRHEHFLCENEACLEKKFVVFRSEVEMKRHNAMEHGGQMSRSKRNAALQIPISFRYRHGNEQDQWRGRRLGFRSEPSETQLSVAIQASVTAFVEGSREPPYGNTPLIRHGEASQAGDFASSIETLSISSQSVSSSSSTVANSLSSGNGSVLEEIAFPHISGFERPQVSSSYVQALNPRSSARLGENSFPPLPGLRGDSKGVAKVLPSARPRPIENFEVGFSSAASSRMNSIQYVQPVPSTPYSNSWGVPNPLAPSSSSATQMGENGIAGTISASSILTSTRSKHSTSAPDLIPSISPASQMASAPVKDIHRANKSLVQSIRTSLGMDEGRYAAFKCISAEYRQDQISPLEYLSYVEQFGLSHLVEALAQLCPEPRKQKELIDAHVFSLHAKDPQQNRCNGVKGKAKTVGEAENSTGDDALADSFLNQVRKLQSSHHHSEGEVEVLSKDGYRTTKVKNSSVDTKVVNSSGKMETIGKQISDGETAKKKMSSSKCNGSNLADVVIPTRGVWRNGGGKKLINQMSSSK
ncbi:hypothetical protein HPP92_002324 [Vanilla planifolia]|uniref:C2H2-type domain-containing protein n=1 Tax=Vanilla planifolia TaxID=51239 RepID=A0A835VKI0_VANPL|nr:hypothetical protein HPP92_002324 [Vanilla planifolia]